MVSPYFEGAESISSTGLTRFQGSKGDLGRKPENATKTGLEILLGTSREILDCSTFAVEEAFFEAK